MEGKLNAYRTTMMGRPILKETAYKSKLPSISAPTNTEEEKPIIITRNTGFNLWQWFRKYCK